MKCILCGRFFCDETLTVKSQIKSKSYLHKIPREVCEYCISKKSAHRKAQRLEIPDEAIDGCFRLAGAVARGCIQHYRQLYLGALKEVMLTKRIDGEAVDDFLYYDQEFHRPYYANLTLGKMPVLAEYARRKEDENLSGDMARAAERIKDLITGGRCNEDRIASAS